MVFAALFGWTTAVYKTETRIFFFTVEAMKNGTPIYFA